MAHIAMRLPGLGAVIGVAEEHVEAFLRRGFTRADDSTGPDAPEPAAEPAQEPPEGAPGTTAPPTVSDDLQEAAEDAAADAKPDPSKGGEPDGVRGDVGPAGSGRVGAKRR